MDLSDVDLSTLRTQLDLVFDDVGLDAFCHDHFSQVYDRWARGQRKDEKLTMLLDHCRRSPVEMERLIRLLPSFSITPVAPRPYHNLPQADYTTFVGREVELAWLRECLSPQDRAWQIAITGIGGVGKSALALAIAHEYCERYAELPVEERFDAIIWVSAKEEILTAQGREPADLPGSILRTLEDVYTAISRTLEREDITRAQPEEQPSLIDKVLRQQRTLLIMDNLESIKDDRIKPFLRHLPAPTKVIITSRVWLDVAEVHVLMGLCWEDAECLIGQEAETRRVRLDKKQYRRIFDLTSGLPLPIRLSIGRMAGGESFELITRWLGDAVGDLPEYCVKGQVERVHECDPCAWTVLLTCSLFDRGVGGSRKAVGSIADLSLADQDQALAHLQRLFLINHTEDERFWTLPIVQRYIGAQFSCSAIGVTVVDRWLQWLVEFSKSYGFDLEQRPENISMLKLDYLNVLNGLRWARQKKLWDCTFNLARGVFDYAYITGLFNESNEALDAAMEASKNNQNERQRGWVEARLGRYASHQGKYNEALAYLRHAEEVAEGYHDDFELIRAWNTHTFILFETGELDEAETLSLRTLELCKKIEALYFRALACERLSRIAIARENFSESSMWLDNAEECIRESNQLERFPALYHWKGIGFLAQGIFDQAEKCFSQAIVLKNLTNQSRYVAYDKYGLAVVYAKIGRLDLARQIGEEAKELFSRMGMKIRAAEVEGFLKQINQHFR